MLPVQKKTTSRLKLVWNSSVGHGWGVQPTTVTDTIFDNATSYKDNHQITHAGRLFRYIKPILKIIVKLPKYGEIV